MTPAFLAKQKQVLELKRTMSPTTGLPHSYVEIGKIMGMSHGCARYAPKTKHDYRCPCCLQELQKSEVAL